MQFGHNTNVPLDDEVLHVQTEDRGPVSALIDTTIYLRGSVLHRRTNNYLDLLPLNEERGAVVKARLDEQHRAVIEELRSGSLKLVLPPKPSTAKAVAAQQKSSPLKLNVELLNAKTWLTGKHASLQVRAQDASGRPVTHEIVVARVEGAATPAEFHGQTDEKGEARIEFDMPKLASPEAALVIEVVRGNMNGQARFQLRAKPRIPVS